MKISGYDITPSHVARCVINQQHDMMFGKIEAGVLKSSHKVYVLDKYNLATRGSMSVVPLRFVPMRNLHDILVYFGEDAQETRLSSQNGDDDVPDISPNMLTKS